MRHAVAVALIGLAAAPLGGREPADRSPVDRARTYLREWERALAAVVAEERYVQTLETFPSGRFVASAGNSTVERELRSDVLLVRAADEHWLMFRDVFAVDGKRVGDRERRFDDLFVRPDSTLIATARRIAEEGARYNLGSLTRTINTPVAGLVFLKDQYRESVRWRTGRMASVGGRRAVAIDFEQKRAPFAIRSPEGEPMPAEGTLWVESDSGRIVQSQLVVIGRGSDRTRRGRLNDVITRTQVRVQFGPVPAIEPWVPLRMSDSYSLEARFAEELAAHAVYSNHRLFQTGGRIIGHGRE